MNKLFTRNSNFGFTIVEVMVVIIVIGILAGIVTVGYGGAQDRARLTVYKNDIDQVKLIIEEYRNEYNHYPNTTNNPKSNWHASDVYIDSNCMTTGGAARTPDWVPFVDTDLPLSNVSVSSGVDDIPGCYMYVSNGEEYVISAWNVYDDPSTGEGYRRVGFRQFTGSESSTQFYTCNSNVVGGANGTYDATQDYYKHSYTVSNITDCDETPPSGA